jgi:hypothetical protein
MWRRSNPYPDMATFDAPNREVCTLRRSSTNTPLHALVTLNDPVHVEAAQALARRIVTEVPGPPDDHDSTTTRRAEYAFRLCLARPPRAEELARLLAAYEQALAQFRQAPQEAMQLASDPLGPVPDGLDPAELAAWTVLGNVLLNLDEALFKR